MLKYLNLIVLCICAALVSGSSCNMLALTGHYDTDILSVSQFADDITDKQNLDLTENRDQDIENLLSIMNQPKDNNVILLGKPGAGKTSLVDELIARIKKGQVPQKFAGKRVIQISFGKAKDNIPGGLKVYAEQWVDLIERAIRYYGRDAIYFIDEFQTIVDDTTKFRIADLMKPVIDEYSNLIIATTVQEFKDSFRDPAILRRLRPLMLFDTSFDATKAILVKLKPHFKNRSGVDVTDQNINTSAHLAIVLFENSAPQFWARRILEKGLKSVGKKALTDNELIQAAADLAKVKFPDAQAALAKDPQVEVDARNDAMRYGLAAFMALNN